MNMKKILKRFLWIDKLENENRDLRRKVDILHEALGGNLWISGSGISANSIVADKIVYGSNLIDKIKKEQSE